MRDLLSHKSCASAVTIRRDSGRRATATRVPETTTGAPFRAGRGGIRVTGLIDAVERGTLDLERTDGRNLLWAIELQLSAVKQAQAAQFL